MLTAADFAAQWADVPPWEPPDEPPQRNGQRQQQASAEPTTWEAFDLGPYLRGEIERPHPGIGISRSDGQRSLYPGREHAIVGETESGKTWFALGCAAAELNAGNDVVYIHYEEPDATSTVEKLCLLGSTRGDQGPVSVRRSQPPRP